MGFVFVGPNQRATSKQLINRLTAICFGPPWRACPLGQRHSRPNHPLTHGQNNRNRLVSYRCLPTFPLLPTSSSPPLSMRPPLFLDLPAPSLCHVYTLRMHMPLRPFLLRPHVGDFLEEAVQVQPLALERAPEHGKLVEHAPQGPNVALPPVAVPSEHLGRHVERGSHLYIQDPNKKTAQASKQASKQ